MLIPSNIGTSDNILPGVMTSVLKNVPVLSVAYNEVEPEDKFCQKKLKKSSNKFYIARETCLSGSSSFALFDNMALSAAFKR